MTLEQGQVLIRKYANNCSIKTLNIKNAVGKILAENISATIDQPPFPRSPLDGYAVKSKDIASATKENPILLQVVEKVCAGGFSSVVIGEKEACRIMTGAPIPEGADCIVRQEDTNLGEETVEVYTPIGSYQNYCSQGEDFKKDDVLLQKGIKIDSTAIAVVAGSGKLELKVYAPKVLVLSTGDELIEVDKPLQQGKIYDMNNAYLLARLLELGVDDVDGMVIGDDWDKLKIMLQTSIKKYDFVITTGGVSVGEKDLLPYLIPEIGGEVIFHGLKLKPGSSVMFSMYKNIPILSLPGNPFAAMATFELLGRVVLAKLCGEELMYQTDKAKLGTEFKKASPSRRFVRGKCQNGTVILPKGHSSGQIASSLGCNCLVDIHKANKGLRVGEEIDIIYMK